MSHLKSNDECQDLIKIADCINHEVNYKIICISDGAGSALFSSLGAQITIDSFIKIISNYSDNLNTINEYIVKTWINETVTEIKKLKPTKINSNLKDFSCTILICILSEINSYFFQIGDGAWIIEEENKFKLVTIPYKGEYINETVFITSKDAVNYLQFYKCKSKLNSIIGFTDGLESIFINNSEANSSLSDHLLKEIKKSSDIETINSHLYNFLNSEMISNRSDDDKTLCVAWLEEKIETTNDINAI